MAVNLLDFLPDSYSIYLTDEEIFYAELCCLTGTPRYDWGFADERNVEFATYILDEFFCGKSYDEVVAILQMGKKSIEERIELLKSPYDCEVELKFDDGSVVTGVQKRGDWLIDSQNNKRYKITE